MVPSAVQPRSRGDLFFLAQAPKRSFWGDFDTNSPQHRESRRKNLPQMSVEVAAVVVEPEQKSAASKEWQETLSHDAERKKPRTRAE